MSLNCNMWVTAVSIWRRLSILSFLIVCAAWLEVKIKVKVKVRSGSKSKSKSKCSQSAAIVQSCFLFDVFRITGRKQMFCVFEQAANAAGHGVTFHELPLYFTNIYCPKIKNAQAQNKTIVFLTYLSSRPFECPTIAAHLFPSPCPCPSRLRDSRTSVPLHFVQRRLWNCLEVVGPS